MKGVTRMLSAYPETSTGSSDDYLVTLAHVLCQYPREIAVQACSPIHGVPKQCTKFRPTAGQVRQWCEEASESLYERLKLQTRPLPAPTVPQTTEAERCAHVARILGRKLSADDNGKRKQPGWLTEKDAADILQRYERDAQQNQSIDEELI